MNYEWNSKLATCQHFQSPTLQHYLTNPVTSKSSSLDCYSDLDICFASQLSLHLHLGSQAAVQVGAGTCQCSIYGIMNSDSPRQPQASDLANTDCVLTPWRQCVRFSQICEIILLLDTQTHIFQIHHHLQNLWVPKPSVFLQLLVPFQLTWLTLASFQVQNSWVAISAMHLL